MIHRSQFMLDEKRKEILPSYSTDFPFTCLDVSLDSFIGRGLHWHPATEIDYVTDGELEYQIQDRETVILKKGDVIFINSNIMHSARSSQKDAPGSIYAFLFGVEYMLSMVGSQLNNKYILPLHQNPDIPFYVLHPTIPDHIHIIELLLKLPALADQEKYGYEFEIRDTLCRIWLLLLKETEHIPKKKTGIKRSEDYERIKQMVRFIQDNYMENIGLKHIAASASLSERECNRCFQRNINMTPIAYLNQFRIRIAAQMLLHTNESIFTISESCGFNSNSYFGRVFKEMTGKTPNEYRKNS